MKKPALYGSWLKQKPSTYFRTGHPSCSPSLVHFISHYLQKLKALAQLKILARLKNNNLPNAKLKMRDDIFLTFLMNGLLEKNLLVSSAEKTSSAGIAFYFCSIIIDEGSNKTV
jgi:hypothetical protein